MKYDTTKMLVIYRLLKQHGGCFLSLWWSMNHPLSEIEVHLEGLHVVYYKEGEHENAKIVGKEKSTKLIAYFTANQKYPNACHVHYVDFPKYFRWDKTVKQWKPRAKYKVRNTSPPQYDFPNVQERLVGRMYNISPREGEQHSCYTNQEQLLSRICASMKVYNT